MTSSTLPAAGWYRAPHVKNEVRYWDGARWWEPARTAHGAPASRALQRDTRMRAAPASWISAVLFALLLGFTLWQQGLGVFLVVLGVIVTVTGTYVLLTRRRSWARLPGSRRVGALVALVGIALAVPGTLAR